MCARLEFSSDLTEFGQPAFSLAQSRDCFLQSSDTQRDNGTGVSSGSKTPAELTALVLSTLLTVTMIDVDQAHSLNRTCQGSGFTVEGTYLLRNSRQGYGAHVPFADPALVKVQAMIVPDRCSLLLPSYDATLLLFAGSSLAASRQLVQDQWGSLERLAAQCAIHSSRARGSR